MGARNHHPARTPSSRGGTSACPNRQPAAPHPQSQPPPCTSRSKNLAAQSPSSKINTETVRYRLTHTLLRWCLYDGQCHPFSLVEGLRGGTHPLAVGPVNPGLLSRTGRSDRQRRWVPQKPGTRPTDRFAGQPERRQPNRRSGRDPGPRPYAPRQVKAREAGPEALPTPSLPIICTDSVTAHRRRRVHCPGPCRSARACFSSGNWDASKKRVISH
jgi:hypothetical protein